MSNPESLALVVEEWARAAGVELRAVAHAGAEVRIGGPEQGRGYVLPPDLGEESTPPQLVVASGVEVEGYFLARRAEGGLVAFRRGPDGVLHRCETGANHFVLGRLLQRVIYDRAKAKRAELGPLLDDLLGPAADWDHPLPPNPQVLQPKKVLTAEELAARKAAKAARRAAKTPVPPPAQSAPPTRPEPEPKPRPSPAPAPAAGPRTPLAGRVRGAKP